MLNVDVVLALLLLGIVSCFGPTIVISTKIRLCLDLIIFLWNLLN